MAGRHNLDQVDWGRGFGRRCSGLHCGARIGWIIAGFPGDEASNWGSSVTPTSTSELEIAVFLAVEPNTDSWRTPSAMTSLRSMGLVLWFGQQPVEAEVRKLTAGSSPHRGLRFDDEIDGGGPSPGGRYARSRALSCGRCGTDHVASKWRRCVAFAKASS
jgi:hypothetical protein